MFNCNLEKKRLFFIQKKVQQHTYLDIKGDACECPDPPCTCESTEEINITDISNGGFGAQLDYPVQINGYFDEE